MSRVYGLTGRWQRQPDLSDVVPKYRLRTSGPCAAGKGATICLRPGARRPLAPASVDRQRGSADDRPRAPRDRAGACRHVTLLGSLVNVETQARRRASGYRVLPGRYVGWGAAMNEGLLAGTPELLSREVCARALVTSGVVGEVLLDTIEDMADALWRVIVSEPVSAARRDVIEQWPTARSHPNAPRVTSCGRSAAILPISRR